MVRRESVTRVGTTSHWTLGREVHLARGAPSERPPQLPSLTPPAELGCPDHVVPVQIAVHRTTRGSDLVVHT